MIKYKERVIKGRVGHTPTRLLYDAENVAPLKDLVATTMDGFSLAMDSSQHTANIHYVKAGEITKGEVLEAVDGIIVEGILEVKQTIHLILLTADCAPIAISSKSGDMIGLLHGGWQGISRGIIQNFDKLITQKGLKREDAYIEVGPMVGENYEFSISDVEKHFTPMVDTLGLQMSNYTGISEKEGKCMFQLKKLIKDIFLALGYDKFQIGFHHLETSNYKNRLPSHRLYSTATRLLKQVATSEFQDRLSSGLRAQIFADGKGIFSGQLNSIQRELIAPYLDCPSEEKVFFKSPCFDTYMRSSRMMSVVSSEKK